MKLFALAATLLLSAPALAETVPTKPKIYRPFTYETPCALEAGMQTYFDTCKVVETREIGRAHV